MTKYLAFILKNKIIRFILVSGINTIFGYGLFSFLIYCGLHYPIALFISTFTGIIFNFKTTGIIVFKNANNILIFKFFGVYGITFGFNLLGIALLKYIGFNMYICGFVLLLPIGLLAFFLNNKFVFTTRNNVNL